jgi:CelD/BcsL family acetyltransferase involved in cellulose biosynthesis
MGPAGALALVPVVHRLCAEPWDALVLRDVPREASGLDVLTQAFRDEGCAVAFESPMDSPYVPLPTDWSELEKRLEARFRQNLRRRRRRLEEHGPVHFEVISGTDGLDAALEDAFAIEASGWKGAEGSAIRARPELVAFYASWARQLAASGRLRLCFLTASDKRIAFHFGFVQGKRYYLPKCGFDESFQECSPGQLLTADVLRRCIEEHLDTFEFLGFSMPWKRDWTPLVRPHATLWAFRPTLRGQWARAMRAEIRPRAAAFWNEVTTRFARWRNPA